MNRLVAGLEEMIDRTVGPAVEVVVKGSPDLWVVKVDPPQLENALLNLCINARDAMGRSGGRLTIQTTNHGVEDEVGPRHDLPTGDYISICVIDTGTGMTAEVAKHAFEPFFTTKPAGEGTGLGLSMVYGFVRQSGGQVRLDTAPGAGTTVCVYLPRHDGVVSVDKREGPAEAAAPRERCIVLVEDEETIREILTEELTGLGYRVLEAGDGPAGLRILQSAVEVDLLLTDVGLPGGMNGRQVADAARVSRPDLKVLFHHRLRAERRGSQRAARPRHGGHHEALRHRRPRSQGRGDDQPDRGIARSRGLRSEPPLTPRRRRRGGGRRGRCPSGRGPRRRSPSRSAA